MEFTIDNIADIAGDNFKVTAVRGNMKVDIRALAEGNARGITDEQKCRLLVEVAGRLRDKGFEPEVRLSYRDQSGNWRPWPTVWVNRQAQSSQEQNERLDRMESIVSQLVEALSNSTDTDEDGDGVVEDETPATF